MLKDTTNSTAECTAPSRIPRTKIQKIIADRMLLSKRNIPCFYLQATADITELMALRTKLTKSLGTKITSNDFFIRSMAMAIGKFPLIAGRLHKASIQIAKGVNIGFAVVAPYGLVVPVVKNADKLNLADIAQKSAELIKKARSNKLSPDELEGACITLSNLGVYAIDSFFAVITPGQAGILAVGNITKTPVPQNGSVIIRKTVVLGLTVDHRIINGDYAADFLNCIVNQLQTPQALHR